MSTRVARSVFMFSSWEYAIGRCLVNLSGDAMAPFDRRYVAVLGAVVEAGRAALREMDGDEVPARLQRVARSTGKGLPAPLASSLLAEIDASDWLRDKVIASYEAMGRDDPVAEAFLRRGDDWWMVVSGAMADAAGAESAARLAAAKGEVASLQRRLKAAKQRERELGGRIGDLEAGRSGAAEERVAPLRQAADRERRRADDAEERLAAAREELARAAKGLADVEERQRLLYERFSRTRAERSELERRLATGDRGAIPSDPAGIARWLDDAARILAPYREGEEGGRPAAVAGDRAPLQLPPGVRPDDREAIEALRQLGPRWVLVDGHNVLGAIDHRSIGDAAARRNLIAGLGLLARTLAPASIVVVFDSALGGGREAVDAASGITVRFSPAASAADDVLAEEAEELGPGTVVISNDRGVRERTAPAGALVLWSDALVAWLSEARREGVTTV
ncbi:MAG: hypothetical protein EHM57_08305 [Actinobacteria bacterium]|nr:MAG: hypothetical protein EHM57_08305 [Actinomycetota bacterium]